MSNLGLPVGRNGKCHEARRKINEKALLQFINICNCLIFFFYIAGQYIQGNAFGSMVVEYALHNRREENSHKDSQGRKFIHADKIYAYRIFDKLCKLNNT